MFEYIGQSTEFKEYVNFGLLTTHVFGLSESKPKTLVVKTKIPESPNGLAEISIMVHNRDGDNRYATQTRLEFALNKGAYEKVKISGLLAAHSECLRKLKEGIIIKDSRLADILLQHDEQEASAR